MSIKETIVIEGIFLRLVWNRMAFFQITPARFREQADGSF